MITAVNPGACRPGGVVDRGTHAAALRTGVDEKGTPHRFSSMAVSDHGDAVAHIDKPGKTAYSITSLRTRANNHPPV